MTDENIEAAIKRTEKLLSNLELFRDVYNCGFIKSARIRIPTILFNAELIPIAIRKLMNSLIYSDEIKAEVENEVGEAVAEASGIHIEMTDDGIFYVRLPELMPRIKGRMRTNYVRDTLFLALKRYHDAYHAEHNAAPDYTGLKPCFIVIKHIFDGNRASRNRLIDYDNFDQKQVIDMITFRTIGDDNPSVCEVIMCAGYAEAACTEVRLVPADKFAGWFQNDMKSHLMFMKKECLST